MLLIKSLLLIAALILIFISVRIIIITAKNESSVENKIEDK